MTVEMSAEQFERLITTLQGGGGGGAAGAAGAAAVVGPMGPCVLGKDSENKMRFLGITNSG